MAAPFTSIEDALVDLRRGKMVVVCDDEDRENEGDLVIAAEFATADDINFMITEGRGLVCLALTGERCDDLGLPPMSSERGDSFGTAFTVSIDARHGVSTGISPADRARTIQVAVDPSTKPQDLTYAGHVFPLRAKKGGVLIRRGHTEASVDLARMAGLIPAGVICEVINEDGSMARVPDLAALCARWSLKMVTIADLVAFRDAKEPLVERVVETHLPTASGSFTATGYRSVGDGREHMALVKGVVRQQEDVLAIVARYCGSGHVFRSTLCECREQLDAALLAIERRDAGVLVLIGREPCDGSLLAHGPPDRSAATGGQSLADDGIAASILADLGIAGASIVGQDGSAGGAERGDEASPGAVSPHQLPSSHNELFVHGRPPRSREGPQWSSGIRHIDWAGERTCGSLD
jgi:3,4-dihydroxy 2-butanone 4-phosphate synthase/GTP cyclohydrolase II